MGISGPPTPSYAKAAGLNPVLRLGIAALESLGTISIRGKAVVEVSGHAA